MAKVRGPILSIAARGTIAKSQVYATWRGVPYARQYTVPSNPNSTAQQTTRSTFSVLDDIYKKLGAIGRAPWDAAAKGRPFTGRNHIISVNLPLTRGDANMQQFQGSPGSAGGLGPSTVSAAATAVAGELSITTNVAGIPTGWTLAAIQVEAFADFNPTSAKSGFFTEAEDTTPTAPGNTVITLTGLTSAALYVACGWTKWTRPDGTTAYGPSLTATGTPL